MSRATARCLHKVTERHLTDAHHRCSAPKTDSLRLVHHPRRPACQELHSARRIREGALGRLRSAHITSRPDRMPEQAARCRTLAARRRLMNPAGDPRTSLQRALDSHHGFWEQSRALATEQRLLADDEIAGDILSPSGHRDEDVVMRHPARLARRDRENGREGRHLWAWRLVRQILGRHLGAEPGQSPAHPVISLCTAWRRATC